jgi:hypothetical protein
MPGRLLCAIALAAVCLIAGRLRGDVFILSNQGQIQGELVNKTEVPRQTYVIQVPQGGQVTLDREQVVEVRRESAAQVEYEKIRPQHPDTVDGQWTLAEWCRTNGLTEARQVHLNRILELDPEYLPARRALGYSRVDGRWTTQEQLMTARGYVRYKGEWRLPQEVELLESRRKQELAEKEWFGQIKRWRDWLKGDRWEKALEQIGEIADPDAVPALKHQLSDEPDPRVRKLWLECLGRIHTPAALDLLVTVSLEDPDLEVRLSAIDELEVHGKHPAIAERYIKALRADSNAMINRAGVGLAAVGDATAIGPLIESLVTTHKYKLPRQGNPNAISSTFRTDGGGGGGLSVGSKPPTVIVKTLANENVRDALVKISGANFGFDVDRWRTWHAAQKKADVLNARRD